MEFWQLVLEFEAREEWLMEKSDKENMRELDF